MMDFSDRGTLQDAVNALRMRSVKMEEPLAMFFTIEVMKIVEGLHNSKIIHGDIKPDNFLCMMDETRFSFEYLQLTF